MHDTPHPSWTDEYEIHSYEVGPGGAAPLQVICRFFQESAWHHARSVKQWYDDLLEIGCFWVLSRLTLVMERYPKWGEKITVKTWGSGIDRLFALRDFTVRDGKNEAVGLARSAWLVVNGKTRKPQRIEPLFVGSPVMAELRVFDELPEKLPAPDSPARGESFPVRHSDLDIQNHVNNAQYVEWCLDSSPPALHASHQPRRFSINFLAECAIGDIVSLWTENIRGVPRNDADPRDGTDRGDPAYLVSMRKGPDGKEICRAKIAWSRRREGA